MTWKYNEFASDIFHLRIQGSYSHIRYVGQITCIVSLKQQ